jgi:hypothetical protein
MKLRPLLAFTVPAAVLLAATLAAAATLVGSGRSVTEERKVTGFTGIALSLPAHVNLVQTTVEGLTVTADDNVVPGIETVVESGVLHLRFRKGTTYTAKSPIRINVSAKAIDSIAVAGAGDVNAPGVHAGRLVVTISGSGDVRLGGRVEALDVRISGSGDVDAQRLDAQDATIALAGSGDVVVSARKALKANVAGSGDIGYYGDPAVRKAVVGSGSVRRLGPTPS